MGSRFAEFIFGNHEGDDDEDNELMKETIQGLMKAQRAGRRQFLKKGDKSLECESSLERILMKMKWTMANDQEEAETKYGEDFVMKHTFTKGAFKWIHEMDEEQRLFMIIGVMLSICDAPSMIDLINDLEVSEAPFMEFVERQLEHMKEHQQETAEDIEKMKQELTSEDVIDEADRHLKG